MSPWTALPPPLPAGVMVIDDYGSPSRRYPAAPGLVAWPRGLGKSCRSCLPVLKEGVAAGEFQSPGHLIHRITSTCRDLFQGDGSQRTWEGGPNGQQDRLLGAASIAGSLKSIKAYRLPAVQGICQRESGNIRRICKAAAGPLGNRAPIPGAAGYNAPVTSASTRPSQPAQVNFLRRVLCPLSNWLPSWSR